MKIINKIINILIILTIFLSIMNLLNIIRTYNWILIIGYTLLLRKIINIIFLKVLEFNVDVLIFRKNASQKDIRRLFDKYKKFGKYILSPEFLYLFYFSHQWCWMTYQIVKIQRHKIKPFWNRDKTNLVVSKWI